MDDLEALGAQYKKLCQIYDYIDLRITSMADGVFQCQVPLNDKTGNHLKIMHASVLFAIGEVLGGMVHHKYVADPARFQPVVRDLKIDFKAPAMSTITAAAMFDEGTAVEMNKQLEATGRYDYALAATLTDTHGQVVAETLGHYAIRDFRKKA